MPSTPADWSFDAGAGPSPWPWTRPPDPTALLRARRPRTRTRAGHVPVWAYSTTTGTHLHLESGLEHDLVRELDRRPDVAWLVAQPCRLRLPLKRSGRRVHHVPDLLSLTTTGEVTLWDARPADRQDEAFTAVSRATARACEEVGWRHEVFDGLPRVRRVNLIWLHAYRRPMPWYPGAFRALVGRIGDTGTLADALDLDAGGGHVISATWHSIWSGALECDLNMPFRRHSPIRVARDLVSRP